jgi:RNA polymerase sigma factor (sigma-70 family)
MPTINDQHYINEALRGNEKAFAVIVNHYKDLVFTLANKMLKNREQAEEIAQDTFIKIYRSLSKFKGESKFSTWVYKITYNTCLDFLKQNKKENAILYIEEFSEHQIKAIGSSIENLDETERQKKIHECIELLPSEDAFLLTLYYFDNLSIEEVSKVIGSNANNVKIKLYRSRKKLASILNEQLDQKKLV